MTTNPKTLKIGSKVRIINCILKKYIGRTGKLLETRRGYFGNTSNYNIRLSDVKIWMSVDDIEVI